ncbi:MAG TPA: Stp1/IreP family PP2C-type Ser/Thr phosphatase [Methylococcaceae bacterium]|nr:Stp1/IreP family PP2C-type Ser/Thr phosphatase [Methylococcaceae bacterium]
MKFAFLTDKGCVRENNEDHVGVFVPLDEEKHVESALLIVADGMGGHQGGEVASQLAVEVIRQTCAESGGSSYGDCLGRAFVAANRVILQRAGESPSLLGMGSTATALLLSGQDAWFAHIGDSRLYRLREDVLTQLSEDHSLVAEMVKAGLMTPEQAVRHPSRNIITRALGSDVEPVAQLTGQPIDVQPGDRFLLCSDGLHDLVSDVEMQAAILGSSPDAACHALVELAKERGGKDNISLIIAAVSET